MITTEQIENLIASTLTEKNCFIVTLDVRAGNNILLEIDSIEGVKISDCVDISRAIEHNLDRETEDFELQVASPGLDKPFRVIQQYQKNIGKQVQIETTENAIIKGKLVALNNNLISIEVEKKEKVGKKKQTQRETIQLNINQIKETKIIISFK